MGNSRLTVNDVHIRALSVHLLSPHPLPPGIKRVINFFHKTLCAVRAFKIFQDFTKINVNDSFDETPS